MYLSIGRISEATLVRLNQLTFSSPTAPTGRPTSWPTAPTGMPTFRPTAPTGRPTSRPMIQTGSQKTSSNWFEGFSDLSIIGAGIVIGLGMIYGVRRLVNHYMSSPEAGYAVAEVDYAPDPITVELVENNNPYVTKFEEVQAIAIYGNTPLSITAREGH